VVKRAEYTYAVDWWALGIIMIEGLFGRVSSSVHIEVKLINRSHTVNMQMNLL